MENKNMPANPIEINGFGQYQSEVHKGFTKREMFAMNAPEVPEWFVNEFFINNVSNKNYFEESSCYDESTGINVVDHKTLPEGQMAIIKAWRYAYADMMLED